MSDGCRETVSDRAESSRKSRTTSEDTFGRVIARIAIAQVCESTGFHSFRGSALDAFSDVVIRYICDLGKTAVFYANLSCRTECNAFDVLQALEDLVSLHGFSGASDIHRCHVRSGVVRDVAQYISTTEESPFVRSIPHFPIVQEKKLILSSSQIGETLPGTHIPGWLPALPDPHTYIQTPVWNEKTSDAKAKKVEHVRQRRKAERSLLSLQQRLSGNSTIPLSTDEVDTMKGKQTAASISGANPYLAPPLPYGEKEASPLSSTTGVAEEKNMSVLETFSPIIEAVKVGNINLRDSERNAVPIKRPAVHFRFGICKKSLDIPFFSGAIASEETDSLFLRDDEKNDKKRRAKLILKESMDKPQELHQL